MKDKDIKKVIIIGLIIIYIIWFIFVNCINDRYDYVNKNVTVVFINLDRSKDRLKKITKDLKKYGFSDIVRIKAVDAKGLKSKRDLEDYDNLPCLSFDDDTSNIPHTACYLSHLRAVKYAINSKKEWTLILEDDAIFYKNPKATMGILYDIITKNKYNSAWLCGGTSECYLLNKEGAQQLYSFLNQKSEFVKSYKDIYKQDCLHDWALSKAFKNMSCYYNSSFCGQRCDDISNITGDVNHICYGHIKYPLLSKIKSFIYSYRYW